MPREFKLLTTPYRLYANQQGDAPVTEAALGGFTREDLAKENDRAPMELLINSHGQWNNIDQCLFVGGQEKRSSLLDLDTIKTTLDANAYHNFGVLEPNAAAMALSSSTGYIAQTGQSVPEQTIPNPTQASGEMNANRELMGDGKPVGTANTVKWSEKNKLKTGTYSIHAYTSQKLDNGSIRITLDYTAGSLFLYT